MISLAMGAVFTPSPLRGEGRGVGGAVCVIRALPPSLTLPRKGGGKVFLQGAGHA